MKKKYTLLWIWIVIIFVIFIVFIKNNWQNNNIINNKQQLSDSSVDIPASSVWTFWDNIGTSEEPQPIQVKEENVLWI